MILWAKANLLITLIVITLGALTRLLDAGLGCPDWPGCYGQILPPQSSENIQLANQAHPEFPVEQIKAWSEMIHRFAATSLGLSLFILAIFIAIKKDDITLRSISFIALAWVIVQGIFGMLTVTLRIWPPVVTLHLLGGMVMLALCYWQLKTAQLKQIQSRRLATFAIPTFTSPSFSIPKSLQIPLITVILITLLQMGLGGWTSSHYAGLACPDLPQCQNQWWPETVNGPFHAPMVNAQEYLGGLLPMADRMAIQILHRLTACFLILAALFLGYQLYLQQHKKLAIILAIPLAIQVAIGIANVYLLLPLPLALLHNTGAALVWLSLWYIYFSLADNALESRYE